VPTHRRRAGLLAAAVAAVALLAGPTSLPAQQEPVGPSGVLDTTFGCATPPCPGFAENDLGIYTAVVIDPDRRILAAGGNDAAVFVDAWLENGVLDTSFGSGGRANVPTFGTFTAVALQGDAIVAGGADATSFIVYRFDHDGNVDPTFGTLSGHTADPPGNGRDLVVQPDGKIVMAGFDETTNQFVVARYDENGILDPGFGTGGVATGPGGAAYAVALQSDGKIVVAGVADVPDSMFRVARYDENGVLDPTFGTGGVVTGPEGPSLTGPDKDFTDVAVDPDGHIVLASNDGSSELSPNFRVVRYDASGALDPTFGCAAAPCPGFMTGPTGFVNGNAIALQPDGRIVVGGGSSDAGSTATIRLLRLTANGVLDPTFGCASPPCAGYSDAVEGSIAISVALQADLKIVTVGTILGQFGQNIPVVARFDNFAEPPSVALTAEPTFTG
jgi:uncharacterized delta-60 repeat protein